MLLNYTRSDIFFKMVDCQVQTDFDEPQQKNSLNIFYCSLFSDNEVSTYCDLSSPTDQDTPTTNENLPVTTNNRGNNPNKCSYCKRFLKKSETFPEVNKTVRETNLEDLNEFLEFNQIEPPDEDEVTKSTFKCKACCVNLEEPNELIQHVKENHRPTNIALMCNQCPVAFPLAFQLQAHKEAVHGRSYVINCGFCSKIFSETRLYIRHVMIKHAKDRTKISLRCKVCSRKCKNIKVYRKHQERHKRESEMMLKYKSDGSKGLDLLNSVEEEYICDVCNFVYDSQNALNVHKSHKHEVKEKHECKICMRTFQYRSKLKYHMAKHGGPQYRKSRNIPLSQLRCHICLSNHFNSKTQLDQHLLGVHKVKTETMKILSCNDCDKEFVCRSRLKQHQNMHSKTPQSFVCNICDKKFNTYTGRYNHRIMIHFPEKARFRCTVCTKIFMNKSNMEQHMSGHTGVKRFTCSECGAKFCNNGNLKAHVKSIHGVAVESVGEDGTVETVYVKIKRGPRGQQKNTTTMDEQSLSEDNSETNMEVDETPIAQNFINFQYF